MKKTTLFLILALAAALAAPAYAAVDITGEVKGNLKYNIKDQALSGEGEALTSLKFTSDAARGEIEVKMNPGKSALGSPAFEKNITPKLTAAWIELDGAYWKGTQPVTTKFGRFWNAVDPWVASFGYKNKPAEGVQVSGIDVGPVSATAFVGFFDGAYHNSYKVERLGGVSLKGNLDIVDVTATYVAVDGAAGSTNDYAVTAAVEPVSGVKANVAFAGNGANDATAWKVGGELNTIDNFDITGSVWSTGADFDPAFPKRGSDEHGKSASEFTSDEKGFKVGVKTEQAGLPISASYESKSDLNGDNPAGKIEVGTNVAAFDVKYVLETKDNKTDKQKVTVSRKVDVPGLDNFKATLETELKPGEAMSNAIKTEFTALEVVKVKTESKLSDQFHKIEAEYTAPNSVKIKTKFEHDKGATKTSEVVAEYGLKF